MTSDADQPVPDGRAFNGDVVEASTRDVPRAPGAHRGIPRQREGDVFDGDVEHRLRRAERRLRAAAIDAQARDWTAERPDRLAFARLSRAEYEVRTAADVYASPPPFSDWTLSVTNVAAWLVVTVLLLVLAPHPAAPLTLAVVAAGGLLAGQVAMAVVRLIRRRRARHALVEPAAIDDPHFYTDLTRRIKACAAAARADHSDRHRVAADHLDQALIWLDATREVVEESAPGR